MISRAEAQSFDRVAEDYDRLGELAGDEELERSCVTLFPGHQIERLPGPRGPLALVWDARVVK